MPSILKVRIDAARNLPVMDRSTGLTDAFVEINLAGFESQKTQICKRTLNPVWGEDFSFDIGDESIIQSEPLELHALDYDHLSTNGSIGIAFIDLNLLFSGGEGKISGWLPIVDSIRGISGEIYCTVSLQNFSGFKSNLTPAFGIYFSNMSILPPGVNQAVILGFVSATVTDEDPEQHWSDNFRSQRISNEARTRIMFKISGKLRSQLGKQVSKLGGNAVIGVKQNFTIGTEDGKIMGRSTGTAVKIIGCDEGNMDAMNLLYQTVSYNKFWPANISVNTYTMEPDPRSEVQFEYTENFGSRYENIAETNMRLSPTHREEEVIITMNRFPRGTILEIGGLVSAVLVKNVEDDNLYEREVWWTELRNELKSHAKFLFCKHIIGYFESYLIHEDIIILHCMGTAAKIGTSVFSSPSLIPENINYDNNGISNSKNSDYRCSMFHTPYVSKKVPYPMRLSKCRVCGAKYVPDIVFATIDPPSECLATVSHEILDVFATYDIKGKNIKSGITPSMISDIMPFLQYSVHTKLMCKMRIYGYNALFGVNTQFFITGTKITAMSTGTAIHVLAIPPPAPLDLGKSTVEDLNIFSDCVLSRSEILAQAEKYRNEITLEAQEFFKQGQVISTEESSSEEQSDSSSSEVLPQTHGAGIVVLSLDDEVYDEVILAIGYMQSPTFNLCNTLPLEGTLNKLKSCGHIKRPVLLFGIRYVKVTPEIQVGREVFIALNNIYKQFELQGFNCKPCYLTNMNYKIVCIKEDVIQLLATANLLVVSNDNETSENLCFASDKDYPALESSSDREELQDNSKSLSSGFVNKETEYWKSVEAVTNVIITPLEMIPNTKLEKYMGRISLHLVRETSYTCTTGGSKGVLRFFQLFVSEVYAMARTHAVALGGNAVLGYAIDQTVFGSNFKTHGYVMMSVSGDVVKISNT